MPAASSISWRRSVGPRAENQADLALLDDGVGLGAQARVHQQLVDVAQPAGVTVDQVFALARAIQPAGDLDFANGLEQVDAGRACSGRCRCHCRCRARWSRGRWRRARWRLVAGRGRIAGAAAVALGAIATPLNRSRTSAAPVGLRASEPLKMTSSIFSPRRLFALCSPMTQVRASATLLLPHPFGPTIAVTPRSKDSSARSENDLKPDDFQTVEAHVRRAGMVGGAGPGDPSAVYGLNRRTV